MPPLQNPKTARAAKQEAATPSDRRVCLIETAWDSFFFHPAADRTVKSQMNFPAPGLGN